MKKEENKSEKKNDKLDFLLYNKKTFIVAIASFILAILGLIYLIPAKLPKSNLIILIVLLTVITCILFIGFDLAYFIILLMNYLSLKWQIAKYNNQTTDLTFALYNIAWSKEPIFAVLNSLSDDELKMPSKENITKYFGKKPYVNQYLLYSELVKRFSEFEESRLKTIKSFLLIKYQRIRQKINVKIISSSIFWVLLIFWIIFVPQSTKVNLQEVKSIGDLIKILVVNFSGLIRTLIYMDPISFLLICTYLILLFVLLPVVLIDRDIRVHNETEVILATVEEALEDQGTMKDKKSSDSQNCVDESNDNKVENETKKDIDMSKESSKLNSKNSQNKNESKSSKKKVNSKAEKQEIKYVCPYLAYVGYVIAGVLVLSGIFNMIKYGLVIFDFIDGITFSMYYSVYFLYIVAICIIYIDQIHITKKIKYKKQKTVILLNIILGSCVFRPFIECCTQSNYGNMWFYNIVFFIAVSCISIAGHRIHIAKKNEKSANTKADKKHKLKN